MKKILSIIIPILFLASSCQSPIQNKSVGINLNVMTFNIRNGRAKDGENHWQKRKDVVCEVINQHSPDVLGLQEAFSFQLKHIEEMISKYGQVGTGRNGGNKGEYSAILYLKDRFDVADSGTFWLSNTPEKPSSSWGNYYRRICTWARLTDKKSKQSFTVYNTHFDHRSQPSREKSAELIMSVIQDRTDKDPFILMGDFNANETNKVTHYLKGQGPNPSPIPLVDTFRVLYPKAQAAGTSNGGFKGQPDTFKIDYIYVTPNTRTLKAAIFRSKINGRYPSDHYPVTAKIRWE